MDVPLILYFSMWSQTLPLAAGLLAWRRLDSARVWIMFWCAFYLVVNVGARYVGSRGLNNHFMTYLALPIQGTIVLWALSLWQTRPMARLTLRLLIPAFVIAVVVITLTRENTLNFSRIAEPVYSILALGAAITTLLMRSNEEEAPLLRQDWLWICLGLILHFGALAVLTPLAHAYIDTNRDLVMKAYIVRAWINTTAFAMIAVGVFSPRSVRPGLSS